MKKIMIASDLHGDADCCRAMLDTYAASGADELLLLGDLLYHGPRNDLPAGYRPKEVIAMLSAMEKPPICVRGNCEAEVDQMVLNFPCLSEYAQLMADGKLFYLTHGHHKNPQDLPVLPEGSIFLYGHTHVKFDQVVGGIRCLNPGSVSIPKDGSNSCMVYEDGVFRTCILEA